MIAVDELIAFVRQQVDEDERVASACPDKDWPQIGNGAGAVHITRWDPARVLAEVGAKRRILDARDGADKQFRRDRNKSGFAAEADTFDYVVRTLAQPYAGRPGWREVWRA